MKLSDHPPRWTQTRGPKTLGVVMIVRNEAANLPDLFATIRDVADEVVVVDTGSTDGTRAVCKEWGVTLLQERWRDDFAWARNRSIAGATARYLLWLDGDDRLPAATQAELIRLRDGELARRNDRAYLLPVQNTDADDNVFDTFLQTRLFPRRQGVQFVNAIHEQITDSLKALGVELVRTELAVTHTGYAGKQNVQAKGQRNLALLQRALAEHPTSVHHLVHLAQTYAGMERMQEADAVITDAIGYASTDAVAPELLAEFHALRAGYRMLIDNALGATYDLERAAELWPAWGVPYAALAEQHAREDRWDDAGEAAERARGATFVPGVVGFPLTRARSNVEWIMARVRLQRGDEAGAGACLREALEHEPRNLDARMDLGQLLLQREQFAEARAVLEPAGSDVAAVPRLVEVSAAIGLARAATGDHDGAGACLAPLLDVFAAELRGADEVGPIELAEVMLRAGHGNAAKNMIALFRQTVVAA